MIFGELGRRAHVDPLCVRRPARRRRPSIVVRSGGPGGSGVFIGATTAAASAGQTLSRMRACAAAVGWIRSAWNSARSSPKPSNTYGTTGSAPRLRDVGEQRVERARVRRAVIGRHLHADDQRLRARRLHGGDHRVEIRARRLRSPPRSASLPPSSMTTIAGRCSRSRAGRRARPPAVVSPEIDALTTRSRWPFLASRAASRSTQPSPLREPVAGRDRVADDEQHRRRGLRLRRRPADDARGLAAAAGCGQRTIAMPGL